MTSTFSLRQFAIATCAFLLSPMALAAPTNSELQSLGLRYLELASASYSASLSEALNMQAAIGKFLQAPSAETLGTARQAWIKARVPYGQTEAFRFGNPPVDEWEPQVNAWPLDEGFIDYVDQRNYYYELGNPVGQANLIANTSLSYGPQVLDLSNLTPQLLGSLNELGGTEANVATGWHAIEFLLWGQDLNGTKAGAGDRPASDYALRETDCTHAHCDRRRDYLRSVTELLIEDLQEINRIWDRNSADSYANLFAKLDGREQLRRMLFGVGSLSLGELAGERMKVALYANSPEDEHDCFSDNTHATLLNAELGIANVLRGQHGSDSASNTGLSVLNLLQKYDAELAKRLDSALLDSTQAIAKLTTSAEAGVAFDQLIAPGNSAGTTLIQGAINALIAQARLLEETAVALGLSSLAANSEGHL